jgi:hypothetical protein
VKLLNREHPQCPTIGLVCDKCRTEDRGGRDVPRHGQSWSVPDDDEEGKVRPGVGFQTTTVRQRSGLSAINRDDPENPLLFQAFGEWEWDFCPKCFAELVKGIRVGCYSDVDEHGTPLSSLEDTRDKGRNGKPHGAIVDGIQLLRQAVFPEGHPATAKLHALIDEIWAIAKHEEKSDAS